MPIFKSLPQPFSSMYFNETWHICSVVFFVIPNKFARICLNIFGDTVIQRFKSRRTRKKSLVPMSRQKKLADLFLVFPSRPKHDQTRFNRILSLNFPAMRPLGTFTQFYQTVAMETMIVTNI